jgi:hypothetical protein
MEIESSIHGQEDQPPKLTIWQLVILVLSILVIGLLVMTTFVSIDKESESVIGAFDNVICVIFIVDWTPGQSPQ